MLSKNWLQKVLFVCLNMSTFKVETTKSQLLMLVYDIANWTCVLWYYCTLSSKTLIAVQHRFVSSQLSICGRAVDALSCSCLYVYWKSYVAGQKKFKVVVPQREHMDLIVNIRSQKKAKKLDVGLPSYIPIQHKRKPRSLVLSPATDHLCATRYSWLFLWVLS